MKTLRKEKYYIKLELDLEPEQTAAGRRQNIRMYIINLRNRRLTSENLDRLVMFMPSLQRRLTGEPDLSEFMKARIWKKCLTSPFCYKEEEEENTKNCPLLAKPARVMMSPAGFRPAAGTLLSPVHPDKADIAVLKADGRNEVLNVQQDDESLHRIVSSVYSAAEEQMKGWFRVSDYTEDREMTLSVMCYFPPEKRVEGDETQKEMQREETFKEEKLPQRLRL